MEHNKTTKSLYTLPKSITYIDYFIVQT